MASLEEVDFKAILFGTDGEQDDGTTVTHLGRLQRIRIEALKMEQDLNPLINEFKTYQRSLQERKVKLKNNKLEFHERKRSSRYLKRNQKQRTDAEKKTRANKKLIEERKEFIEKSYEEINALGTECQQLNKKTRKDCIHPRFMDAVVKLGKQFQDPQELVTHFNTRQLVQDELKRCIKKKEVELAEYCAELDRIKEQYILNRDNQLAKIRCLKYKLLKTKQSFRDWDRVWQDAQWVEKAKSCQEHEINLAISNLSRYLWKMGIDIPNPTNADETIMVMGKIQEFICELKTLWETLNQTKNSE